MNKRIKSLLLCLVMVFTLAATAVPALAASAEPVLVSDGEGNEAAPVNEAAPTDGEGNEAAPIADGNDDTEIPIIPSVPGELTPNAIPSISIPFTKTVVKGGDVEPGEQSFNLELIKNDGTPYSLPEGVRYTATVSTNGARSYDGSIVITGNNAEAMANLEPFSFFVREADAGDQRWVYDTRVYFVSIWKNAEGGYEITIQNAESDGNGGYQAVNSSSSVAMVLENTYLENNIKVTIPFTKTVKLGGEVAPGAQDFELELLGFVDGNGEVNYPGVSYAATVSTNGAGEYEGTLVITGPESEVREKLAAEGFCVREKNTGADKWTYDSAVWFVKVNGDGMLIVPAAKTENNYYDAAEGATPVAKMTFENTYTENKPAPTATPKPSAPKTGDESALALWLTLVLGGTAAAAVVIGTRKKTDR